MYIAICEDCAGERRQLAAAIESFAAETGCCLRFRAFENAEDMLDAARHEPFTHYFLDIAMPCMDGMTAAQEIRSFDQDAKIVFLTSFREYAYQGFRVRASDYLLKPVAGKELHELLERFRTEEEISGEGLSIQNGHGLMRIPFVLLSHLEVNQKKLYFHMADGKLRQLPGTLAEYERELLTRLEFVKIHRSYIVNLRHVSMLSPEGCVLFSGKNLPVSRLLYKQVRQAYMEYLFGGREL